MPPTNPGPPLSRCTGCGAAFHCGFGGATPCWCSEYPALPRDRLKADAGCLCEKCLRAQLHERSPERSADAR